MLSRKFYSLYTLKNYGIWSRSKIYQRRRFSKNEVLDWRGAVSRSERIVGSTSFVNPVWLFNEMIAGGSNKLRKLVKTNTVVKYAKNLLNESHSKINHGLIILLVSKAAGFNTQDFAENQYESGILHSQRAMAEILEFQSACHVIHEAIANLQEKEKFGDQYQDLLSGNKVVLLAGDYILGKSYLRHGGLCNTEVSELICSCLRDQVEGKLLGEHGVDGKPIPSKPKVNHEVKRYDWENECNLEKLGSNEYLGQGKEEWVLRTMLLTGSILGKGCEAAMKLARQNEIERDAYKLGGHLALLWQLYIDITDSFTNPKSKYSLVGAPVIMALWEYPSIYDQLFLSQRPVNLNELNQAVSSACCMDALSSLLNEELGAVRKYSDRMPVNDAREALQNIAKTLYGEAMKIILRKKFKEHNQQL